MQNISTKVMYQIAVPPLASDDWILKQLYKLKTMQTRVFVVHALTDLASRFFNKVNEAGMMEDGYVWIITEVVMSRLHSLDRVNLDSMHGVLGVKSYIPRSKELTDFEKRWKREFRDRNPKDDETELDMFGIWWYDTVYGLAMALENVVNDNDINTSFRRKREPQTDLDATGTSEMGSSLIPWIRNLTFKGLSGDFRIVNGQLKSSAYQVVNIIDTIQKPISRVIPKGFETPTSNKNVLKIGVPAKGSFVQFVDANTDPETQQVIVTGFCVDVFNAVVSALPYAVKSKFIPFVTPDGKSPAGSYTDLIRNLSNGLYDAVVGDVTILANRWDYVDFTLPYTEAGVSLIVPFLDERKSTWIFVRPIETTLWITTVAFFRYTGFVNFVVWVLEHRVYKEFRGSPHQQVGMIFWFSFSTLVFAHREKLISDLSRFVVIVWVLVVLVLTSSYTASLTSMLTVEQLRPTHTDINQIKRNGESVGYCNKYTMTSFTHKSAGFGSLLVHDVSRAVLQVTEEKIMNISNQWFVEAASCDKRNRANENSSRLMLDSFKGLFLIAGLASTSALLIFFFMFLYQNRQILMSQDSVSRKLAVMAKTFDVFTDEASGKTNSEAAGEEPKNGSSLGIHDEQGFSSEIRVHDTIQVLEITTN
ncbi:putative periplasmic binding protein-like I [Helianthus annuus]|nr:putative periplasmic binding protein-like I [Helianthus annuus]